MATGDKISVETSSAGNYTTPPLVLGSYKVQVEKAGFKTFVAPAVVVNTGTVRLDAALDVGQVTETVEVMASTAQVNVSNPEVSQVLGLAESLLAAQPGYVPMRPNGCPICRGSQFQSRMNGGQTMAMENYLDGASFGSAIDHNNTQERSVPYDSVQETKIVTDNFSAQYGRTRRQQKPEESKGGAGQFHATEATADAQQAQRLQDTLKRSAQMQEARQ